MIITPIITILILTFTHVRPTTFEITPNSLTINTLTNYLWTFAFSPNGTRPTLALSFPAFLSLSPNSTALYNGVPQTLTALTSNSITISAANFSTLPALAITITNVVNPPSAVTSANTFFLTSDF